MIQYVVLVAAVLAEIQAALLAIIAALGFIIGIRHSLRMMRHMLQSEGKK